MLNRRHIRVKVMQTLYSMHQTQSDNLVKEEKFLLYSLESIQDLYLTLVSMLIEVSQKEEEIIQISKNKHLATSLEKNPNRKFVQNKIFAILNQNKSLQTAIEERNINNWKNNDDYILLILLEIKKSSIYLKYMVNSKSNFQEDKEFITAIYTEVIAPNTKLYEYLEDQKLTWVDDIPLVNTLILKQLGEIKDIENNNFFVPKVFKNQEDKEFAINLFKKTILNNKELEAEFANKTPNWETDRIASIDTVILKMAICEFLKFPSMPVKVTINEYLELAKEYSTPKSSIFINGILDSLSKEYQNNQKLNKTGRGLM